MLPADKIRLHHMLDAALEALSFAQGRQRSDLDHDRLLLHGLVRNVEIMGEAASRITDDLKDLEHEIPWLDIVGMRNRLIHAYFDRSYFDIAPDIIWNTVVQDLPTLVTMLRQVLRVEL